MAARIIIFGIVAIFMAMWIAMNLEFFGEFSLFPLFVLAAALFGIAWTVWNAMKYKVVDKTLVIKQPLRDAEAISLDELAAWRELSYNIRSQTRRTLVLMFPDGRSLFIDNQDFEKEYDVLQCLLHDSYLNKKQFSFASSAA